MVKEPIERSQGTSVLSVKPQALDALTTQLDEIEFSALLVIQSFRPDSFFSAEQQERLSELMNLWRLARDQGQDLLPEQQAELNGLVEMELRAATARTSVLMQPENS